MELFRKTATELSKMISNREISAVEILNASYDRTNSVDDKIKAYISVEKDVALKQAQNIDDKIKNGEGLSKLAGIPIAIKDNICIENTNTTCASKILENFNAPYNATVIEKLEQNGLVFSGKVNMDEFAMGSSCENSYFGPTFNPHDVSRVPGGSSGGSAAVVSSGQTAISLGSDTGGSVRQPAAHCGIVGLKPTYGTVSRYGLVAFASSLDQIGPLARSVSDIAMVSDVIYGADKRDSTSYSCPKELCNFSNDLNADVTNLTVGVPREYFADGINAEVKESVLNAVKTYEKMGAKIVEISLPMLEYVLPTYYILSSAEASSNLARFDGIKYGYRAENYDNLVDLYVKSRSEGFGEEVQKRIMLGTYVLSSGYYDAYYNKALAAQRKIKDEFNMAFDKCDVILTPSSPVTAYKIGDKNADPMAMYLGDLCTVAINIAGLPAISLPCGFDSNKMPIGMQLIGKRFADKKIINTAYAFEQETGLTNIIPDIK